MLMVVQHLAGTRGPIDFVEVPSLLFEHFAMAPQVLETVPPDVMEEFRQSELLHSCLCKVLLHRQHCRLLN
jgi:hypothetical protein